MAKKGTILLAGLVSALTGGTFLLGEDVYRELIRAKRKDPSTSLDEASFDRDDKREIELDAIDRIRLSAVFYPAPEKEDSHEYVIVLHDALMPLHHRDTFVAHYLEKKMHALVPDARGCGKSGGTYIGYGYDDRFDLMSWIHWILKRDPHAKIAVHGLGTGAAQALFAGAEHLPSAVYAMISDSCYTTLPAYLERRLRFFSESFLPVRIRLMLLRMMTRLKAGYDIREVTPETAVEQLNVPTLFLHGDADKVLPVEMCRALYRRARCTRQIGVFLGAGHLEGAQTSGVRYFKQTDTFLHKQHPDRL